MFHRITRHVTRRRVLVVLGIFAAAAASWIFYRSIQNRARMPGVPQTWDDRLLAEALLPLASAEHSPKPISARKYYWIPIRRIEKTYPVYHPDHEPEGYIEFLKQQEPEEIWSTEHLKTPDDWAKAGKAVFEAPIFAGAIGTVSAEYFETLYVRDKQWHEHIGAPVASDGTLPYYRYVIREKGKLGVGVLSCAMCHTRVLDDGSIVAGAQGNLPFDRALAYDNRVGQGDPEQIVSFDRFLFHAPWTTEEEAPPAADPEAVNARHEALPAGVMGRHGSSTLYPVVIPDLFELKDRRYFDRTGVQQNRGIGDVMRYAALNQGGDDLSTFGDFNPIKDMVGFMPPAMMILSGRYSDDHLYALAHYLYSLQPPANPHPFNELAKRGLRVFESEGCARCHTPPQYTSNKLTPVDGFRIPDAHREKYSIEDESLRTDAGLALRTRRGTGYYKIPSLRHIWLRGPVGHDGSCATLEDWFDPRRLDPDYAPTGFLGANVAARAVPGHEYGLDLDDEDRRALIAFLRTL